MGKPSVGEINTDSKEKKKQSISVLSEVPETSDKTIFNLIFSDKDNKEMVNNEPRDKRN
ncbi:hypothetical protein [Ruminococcus flavefaciens]|uniref:Uncharacterized protein n=1 Tax=Ruminococcus flavefaciens 007c TaxID=1341157 RepID=W7UTP8_RUMFL|nr:hypothetical protein [Ruminococcus flavefaciens]EWM52155.1 hypothetical protein RF007C_01915 [Ruminococcus flavefaciens 007c]